MSSILRAVLSISAASTLSRVTGYARTLAQAAVLGTTVVANAYVISSLLPTLIYELFLGGIIYSIFIPIFVERITNHGEEDARQLARSLATLMVPLLAVVALLGIIFAEPLVNLTTYWAGAEGLSAAEAQETTDLTVLLFRVFILQIVFYGLGALATGILNSYRRFFLPLFTPTLINLTVIASLGGYYFLADTYPTTAIYLLAAGPTVGVALMTLLLVFAIRGLGYTLRPNFGHPALATAARLAGPMLIFVAASVGVQGVAYMFSTSFNAAAEFGYAFVIFSLPYGIFAVAIATALMPELSERHSLGDEEGYRETLSFGLRTMAFVMVPASVGLIALATPIIGVLLERGRFGPEDTANVASLLVAYSVGLLGYAAYFFLVRAFYSRQNTKTPALLNVGLFGLYTALAYGLSQVLELGVVGVALALSGANAVLALVCLAATRWELRSIGGRRLLVSLTRILLAGAVMYAVARGGIYLLGDGAGFAERILVLAAVGSASLAAYLGAAYLLRAEEIKSAAHLLRRRRTPAPEDRTLEP